MLKDLSHSPLRIAVVAPPWFPIPPSGYGGIEAMVHSLVEGLVDRGHEIVLMGAGPDPEQRQVPADLPDTPAVEQLGLVLPEFVHALQAAEHLEDLHVDCEALYRRTVLRASEHGAGRSRG